MSTDVQLKLTFKDAATAGLTKAAATAEKLQNKQLQNTQKTTTQSTAAYAKMHSARETLGVRSEHSIQREIQRTEAAYNRLRRSGVASANDIARAQQAMKNKVTELNAELKKAEGGYSKLNKLAIGGTLAAGVYTTFNATKQAVEQNLSLDERLALRANSAFRGESAEKKNAGIDSMRAGIKNAVSGGMTIDEAMSTLDELIAKNQVGGVQNAIDLLPKVAKFKAGQGGNPVEAASLISTLMSGETPFANSIDQAMRQLDWIAAAGGSGAFETPDFAKHLPAILPFAAANGYVGDAGLKRVLVMLEQGMNTAGNADETANNLKNLFSKMNAEDTAKDFKKMGRGDLSNAMLTAASTGKTPDQVYLEVIREETKNNPKLKAALKKAAEAKNDVEREERIKAVNELAKGQAIGKLFQDMQAKGAFLALLNAEFGELVEKAINSSNDTINKDAAFMETKAGFKTRVASETNRMNQLDMLDKLNPLIGEVADGFSELARKHPELVAAGTLSAGTLASVATAAGLAAFSLRGVGGMSVSIGGAATNMTKLAGVIPNVISALAAFEGGKYLGNEYVKPAIDYLDKKTGLGISDAIGRTVALHMSPFSGDARRALLNDFTNQYNQVENKITAEINVKLDDGLKAKSQTTSTTGPVNAKYNTGNIRMVP